tara:strand:+ start:30552 stop:33002 length:2451 start_codon:yes stop_codon:yes gene_type:complete
MHVYFLYLFILNILFSFNINNAKDTDWIDLADTISEDKMILIKNYIEIKGEIETIYDLMEIDGIDILDINRLKPLLLVEPLSGNLSFSRRSSYKLERWLSSSENQEGLSENWLDLYFNPMNVNNMNYDDLSSLPNLSPIDVRAVLLQKEKGYINGTFQLKNSPGISYYGYKNLIDFVGFDDINSSAKNYFRFSSIIRNTPLTSTPDDDASIVQFYNPEIPQILSKWIVSNKHFSSGYLYNRNVGEISENSTQKFYLSFKKLKPKNMPFNLEVDRLVLGNFTASFGQGIVFESSDFFSPRKTGFGFSKRLNGIHADETRNSQYTLKGLGLQLSNDVFRISMFGSRDKRDAIINEDGSFTSLIVMQPRLSWGLGYNGDTTVFNKMTNSVEEITFGTDIRVSPIIGTNLGFTFYESLYDRVLDPQIRETIVGGPDPDYSGDTYYLTYLTNSADPEIDAMYSNSSDASELLSSLDDFVKSSRKVMGLNFSSVIKNMSIQGEYGALLNNYNIKDLKKSPKASVLSSYFQFDNFNLLLLYRNYDIHFDNPYQRSFSNYQRYKTSILEDSYWLDDPAYAFLYTANPQPQAEEGFYINSRYQFHRNITGILQSDHWTRKADDAKYFRTVVSMQWRPVFKYRVYLRQKWQARGTFDIFHPSPYYSRETRIRVKMLLSNYNELEFLYARGYTTFSPRPRLTDGPNGEDMVVGDIGSPDKTIGISLKYNVNDKFKIRTGSLYITGFTWYFGDNDFRIFDSDFGAFHHWVSFHNLVNERLSFNFKVSFTSDHPMTNITEAQTEQGNWINNPWVSDKQFDYKIQVDYAF